MPEPEDLGQLRDHGAEDEDQHRHGTVEDRVRDARHEDADLGILVSIGLFRSREVGEDFRPRQHFLAPESCDVLHPTECGAEQHIGECELMTTQVG